MHDVIIVGAGSAGAVIASRATEDPHRQVLLVEAGPDYADPATTPFDLVNGHNNSYRDHDWGLAYQPTRGRSVAFPRGRVVGGSSAVNTAIALRGVHEDYDEWADLGNDAWAWDRVLPASNATSTSAKRPITATPDPSASAGIRPRNCCPSMRHFSRAPGTSVTRTAPTATIRWAGAPVPSP